MTVRRHYNPGYFIATGTKSFFRNGFMSLASIIILVSSMLICCSFLLVLLNIDYNIDRIDDFNEVVVYVKLNASDEEVNAIGDQIRAMPQVASCTLITKEESLEKEKERYGAEYEHLFDSYGSDNIPLPDSYRIEYTDVNDLDVLVYKLENTEGIDTVKNRKDIADNISKVKSVILIVCSVLTGMLFIVSLFIIANTIKITLKTREVEITIMRYIGATNLFITMPLIIEAILIALISTGVAYLIQRFSYTYITEQIIADYKIIETVPFSSFSSIVLLGFLTVSLVFSILGTVLSTRQYMRA